MIWGQMFWGRNKVQDIIDQYDARAYRIAEKQLKWDKRFLEVAEVVATWSKDPRKQIGAVIVNDDRKIIGMGFNGFPQGVNDDPARYADADFKRGLVMHAEENAIINAGGNVKGCTMYVSPSWMNPPACVHCTAVIIQNKIKRLVAYRCPDPDPGYQVPIEKYGVPALKEAGVRVDLLDW